jgi:hypothetical protein
LLDLSKYQAYPEDGKIIAWVIEHTHPDREAKNVSMTFKVKVQLVAKLEVADAGEEKAKIETETRSVDPSDDTQNSAKGSADGEVRRDEL